MVQGKTKGLSIKGPNVRAAKKAAANPKKGLRAIAPKKAPLVKQAKMHKELAAKIGKSIEKQMVDAASSGKLTIMKSLISEEDKAKASASKTPKKK
ncbi:hypothetical protein FA13DRAFT_1724144 [Coprinellus micaceus]|uniref:Uncharacterized protein n=1 Tax=Coprinellus micaceus TaxID=71717 RepID=A0A4Y7U0H9_COPMI|nr:hypothetical protein FA13DRAFT_1724144 [Coprinellus micaceus]